jgi:nucleotide-binding universal stress UspA family protein
LVGKLTKLYAEMDEYGEQLAADQARNGAEIANQSGLSARPLTASGKAAHTIVRVAEEEDVALIVMGDQRHGQLGGLVGSVSSRVVREAARPVLIIPGPEPNSRVPKPSA